MRRYILAGAALLGAAMTATTASADSFQASCTRIRQNGPILMAVCQNVYGGWTRTSIDRRACGWGGVANANGQLVCEGGGGGGEWGPRRRRGWG
jgi:hypothetical protein